ncbi:hypothetical protein ZIOFF_026921 [Zingiber officinale]|uniref:C2 DOCK-type domain-containing protein n=1 Tax=Zingiber officinale TaxID=94328 RepID=A0A8J5H5H6_ZINOF|nr:hypothetical protein ZIOFF_026921 [Zingiber officinale]
MLNENIDQWPHLNELLQCYKADWEVDENKYGHYESVAPSSFQNQIFEGPDTDMETEMHLASERLPKNDNVTCDDVPSTSGRQMSEVSLHKSSFNCQDMHFGESPLPPYEPTFDWENERSLIVGQRTPETLPTHTSRLKITVKVMSLSFQAGLIEPFYGTICLYNRDRKEKLSEDFHFCILPTEGQDGNTSLLRRAVFSLDAPSMSICLLIQLEKTATEEGGVTASVYSHKEPIHMTEREKQKLQVWSRIMPCRQSFAWTIIPLFEGNNCTAIGGSASPSSPLTPNASGPTSLDTFAEHVSKIALDGKQAQNLTGDSVIMEISNLNMVKESYTEDLFLDPKRKVHKPVKGVLKLEVEKLHITLVDADYISEGGGRIIDSNDIGDRFTETSLRKHHNHDILGNGSLKFIGTNRINIHRNVLTPSGEDHLNFSDDLEVFDFRRMTRSEPFSQLFHCLYVYPLTVSLSRKRNLFIRIEMRKDDADIQKQPLEAVFPKDQGHTFENNAHTQIAFGARMACYHDEVKLCLPAILTSQHHLLFTFFHVDLQMKLEAPKPVIIGYSALPLTSHIQLFSDVSLPILRELVPHYLQVNSKEGFDFLEDGKNVFKLRLRLCSSLIPVNERIRDFFLEYDRHNLRTSPPWGSELLEAINSFKNVDSTALLQFLHPILNLLLRLIGDGGETLQVAAFRAMVNILTRVQQESSDGADRNSFLVKYVDYAFNDFGGRQAPVYAGLSTVWGSLARSKVTIICIFYILYLLQSHALAKGYRVGPVYDDVLAMAWFFLELIVKSMALEQSRLVYHSLPSGEDVPPLQLKEGVFRCIIQLYDCLLTEVHERCKKGLSFAKLLNSSLAFFCYDLLSIIEPRQVFELVLTVDCNVDNNWGGQSLLRNGCENLKLRLPSKVGGPTRKSNGMLIDGEVCTTTIGTLGNNYKTVELVVNGDHHQFLGKQIATLLAHMVACTYNN